MSDYPIPDSGDQVPGLFGNQPTLFGISSEVLDQGKESRDKTYRDNVSEYPARCKLWLLRIIAAGSRGVTLDELSSVTGHPPNSFSGRITELQDAGLVRRTKERRETRAGSTAAVIVATARATEAKPKQQEFKNMTTRTTTRNDQPDAVTRKPNRDDLNGNPLVDGLAYKINGVRVQCFTADDGVLMIQPIEKIGVAKLGSRPQRVDELPLDCKAYRVND